VDFYESDGVCVIPVLVWWWFGDAASELRRVRVHDYIND